MWNKSHVITASISLLIGFFGASVNLMPEQNYPTHGAPDVDSKSYVLNDHPDETLASAINKIQMLEKKLANADAQCQEFLDKMSYKILVEKDDVADVIHEDFTRKNIVELAEFKSNQLMRWITENTNNDPDFSLEMEMQNQFNAEIINADWSAAQEAQLTNSFIEDEKLSGLALKSAHCRSTQCQISIGIADMDQANLVATKIASVAAQNNFLSAIAVPDLHKGVTTIYISSNKNGFELN